MRLNAPTSFKRHQRVTQLLREELAEIFHRRIKDPRLKAVTITEVEVKPDLKNASIGVCKFMQGEYKEPQEEDRTRLLKAVESAAPFLHEELKKRLYLRIVPHLHFYYDESLALKSAAWGKIREVSEAKSEENHEGV